MTAEGSFVLVGVGEYENADWPRLGHVPASVERLYRLFRSLDYRHELPDLRAGGDLITITGRLRAWDGGGARLVLYWTGHGCVDADEHFLITADSPGTRLDDLRAITTKALARFLVHRDFDEVLILLDCCASGVAASRIATEICTVLDRSTTAGPGRRFAVIASTHGYASAEDGVFAEALDHVVRHGPEDRRWTEHDETIRSDELADAMARIMADRDATPVFVARGAPVPALRNPLHPSATVPDEDVETKRLRRLRATRVDQHLVLSARGIEVGETGWYFCGRERLLRRLVDWLENADRGLFAVTGSPGTGKSALLGRIATLSVPGLRAVAEEEGALKGTPDAALPPLGSVDLALSCRNKNLDDCLRAVADALDLPLHGDGRLPAAQVVRQVGDVGRRVTVVLDGLDEAKAAEAVPIAADLLRPLADLPGVRVLVGTRPHRAGGTTVTADSGPLLQALAPDVTAVLDDEPESRTDLTAYALRRLLDAEHSPLRGQNAQAHTWAGRITEASGGIFLYARVATRAVLGALAQPAGSDRRLDVERLLSGNLAAVLDDEFARSPDPERLRDLLRPLAWAEGSGLPRRDLWPVLAGALSRDGRVYGDTDVSWVLEQAGFHVVESGESGQTVYRLYHQALIDHFRGNSPWDAHTRITRALLSTLPGTGLAAWESAHPYLRRHLAAHARSAGQLPAVMRDLGFLVCADPTRTAAAVRSLPDRFRLPVARLYLRAAHRLPSQSSAERLRTLLMTATFEEPSLVGWFRAHTAVQAVLEAASTAADDFSVVLHGHSGPVLALQAVDAGGGRDDVASAGGDGTVRLWDPHTGETRMVLTGPQETVTALTRLTDAAGRRLLVAAAGRRLHVWDLDSGDRVAVLSGHADSVLCLTVLEGAGAPLLVSAGEDRSIRLWRTDDWASTLLTGHVGRVTALAPVLMPEGRRFLLSTGADCAVRRWDVDAPQGPEAAGVLRGHTGTVYALASLGTTAEGTFVASGGEDGTVRVWDVGRLVLREVIPAKVRGVRALSAFRGRDGHMLLAVAGRGARISVVDPAAGCLRSVLTNRMSAVPEEFDSRVGSGAQLVPVDWEGLSSRAQGHRTVSGGSYAVAALRTGRDDDLFVSAGWDGAVRLWTPDSGGPAEQPDYDGRRSRLVAAFTQPLDEGGLPWALVVAGARGGAWLTDAQGRKRARLWPEHKQIDHLAALVLPDGRAVVGLVEHMSWRLRLVDVESREEITSGESAAVLDRFRGAVTSLRTAVVPGWTTALVVNYSGAGPQALLWLPGDRTHALDNASTKSDLTAVPCVRPRGETLLAGVATGGSVHRRRPRGDWDVISRTTNPPVHGLPPVAVHTSSGVRRLVVVVRGPDDAQHALDVVDLETGRARELARCPAQLTRLAPLGRPDQDLVVAACSDDYLRVWNPARPGQAPLTVPVPGAVADLTATAPDLVYVLVDEHWFALRLTGLGPLLSS
ncbi:AAA family ATPase [Streptomyces sp. NPDC047072]|uniref:AAA family ATPase n=1 Tax=Streptomyces sp. NPDC047072 TaxID=3154809 RepID=UPI0033F714DC